MIPGNVNISDEGVETYTPDDNTNAAKILYLALLANQQANTISSTTITPPVVVMNNDFTMTIKNATAITTQVPVPISVDAKKAQANLSNTLSTWMVLYIQNNLTIYGDTDTTTGSKTQPLANIKVN
jgi:hypothetical protein